MNRFAVVNVRTIAEAAAATATVADVMASAEATEKAEISIVKAGGIDLLDLLKENLLAPAKIVNLRAISGLDTIVEAAGGLLRIGPMVTLADLAADPLVRRRAAALADAAGASASPQIRNVATLGGNLLQRPRCWYFRAADYRCAKKGGDRCFALSGENQYHAVFDNEVCAIVHPSTAATVLVALGATIELSNAQGAKRKFLLEDFFVSPTQDIKRENKLEPHEVLTAIELEPLPARARAVYLKQGEKESFDWPLADVAVGLDFDGARRCKSAAIVLGAAAPVPHRAKAAEAVLLGKPVDDSTAREAAHAALDGATPLAKNAYKLPLFETLVRRAVLAAAAAT